jgi:hypothetical protein
MVPVVSNVPVCTIACLHSVCTLFLCCAFAHTALDFRDRYQCILPYFVNCLCHVLLIFINILATACAHTVVYTYEYCSHLCICLSFNFSICGSSSIVNFINTFYMYMISINRLFNSSRVQLHGAACSCSCICRLILITRHNTVSQSIMIDITLRWFESSCV